MHPSLVGLVLKVSSPIFLGVNSASETFISFDWIGGNK